jgi:hypothetical protein
METTNFKETKGGKGAIYANNVLDVNVSLLLCNFESDTYAISGCLTFECPPGDAGAQRLTVNVRQCGFLHCRTVQDYGVINGFHPRCFIEDTTFEDCTVGTAGGDKGGFIRISVSATNQTILSVVRCNLDNKAYTSASGSSIYFQNVLAQYGQFLFQESSFYWESPDTTTNSPLIFTGLASAFVRNSTFLFTSSLSTAQS